LAFRPALPVRAMRPPVVELQVPAQTKGSSLPLKARFLL